ncbi:MAG: hypothetical protein H7A20_02165 [Rhodanobacteraceae bacterium]|nr:hypothetical protein [Xanthomonadales bacterium]MCP5477595.1 hypothetical protein [Rhodanobacteraceae bacterium]
MRNIKRTLLALACGVAMCGSAAAYNFNETIDGAWTDNSSIGTNKGVLIDYITPANVLFFAFFTYDADGNPIWLATSFVADNSVDTYTSIPVVTYTGGEFDAAGAPAQQAMGTVDINFACDQITMDFHPAEGTGLNDASFNLVRSLGLDPQRASECAVPVESCPVGTTVDGDNCKLPSSITGDMFLPYGKNYIIEGEVDVEEGATLTIDPGVTLVGSENQDVPNFLAVLPGGRIYANGTADLPITFTGPEPVVGSWAGLVLAGKSICNVGSADEPCAFEAVPTITYGGDEPEDSSGALRYVRILYAGQAVAPDEELNALTLLGVGSGTVIDHVQMDHGLDDGVEFFGGTVTGRYMVCSNMADDCFDIDQGFAGKLQFLLAYQGENDLFTGDPNGIEADNNKNNNDLLPRSHPMVSNITLVGSSAATAGEGLRLRRGVGGDFANLVVTGYNDHCLNLDDAGTFALGSASTQGELTMNHSFVGECDAGAFEDKDTDPYLVSSWYNVGAGNGQGDPMLSVFLPQAGSPVLSGGQTLSDPFFVPTTYRGAFSGPTDNWPAGWTVNLPE